MTLEYNSNIPSLNQIQQVLQEQLGHKYECKVVHDRWTLNFSGAQCVLVKKNGVAGICVALNEKKKEVDVDGIVPNMVIEKIFFNNFATRLLLLSSWNKLEKEVAEAIRTKLA
jgi:hypothetical protein